MLRVGKLSVAKISVLAVIVFGSLLIYHREYVGLKFINSPPPAYVPTHIKSEATCPASEWAKGQWVPRKNFTFGPIVDKERVEEVYPMAGFKTCASNRQRDW